MRVEPGLRCRCLASDHRACVSGCHVFEYNANISYHVGVRGGQGFMFCGLVGQFGKAQFFRLLGYGYYAA